MSTESDDSAGTATPGELQAYIQAQTAEGYPAEVVVPAVCPCGSRRFSVRADQDEGCARRTCAACRRRRFICDSAEYWDEAEPRRLICACGKAHWEVAVGFSFTEDGEVRWITVGGRCTACGKPEILAEWKIDYSPSRQLMQQV